MNAKVDVVIGLQWGDEGKGRIVDHYAGDYDIVARFGGGDNAGHTVRVGDTKVALRMVPSGALNERCDLFIGGGAVVSLASLLSELDALAAMGIDAGRVKISDRAHVVFAYHAQEDRDLEERRGGSALGTTGRGIGPAYVDKVARSGITFADLLHPDRVAQRIRDRQQLDRTMAYAERIAPHIVDGVTYLQDALRAGKRVLAEGAQGTLLDVGYGTYPYVTSSHTLAGGACIGLGIGPRAISRVLGVIKAYTTRVGAGPFPSELHDESGERLRRQGAEFGTVTGRPRRCGWFDVVAARYATQINGLTNAAITKLDVLTGFERIGIVTEYRLPGSTASFGDCADPQLQVEIEYMEGWSGDISSVRRIKELPSQALAYVQRIESALGVPVDCVSVGPERTQLAT